MGPGETVDIALCTEDKELVFRLGPQLDYWLASSCVSGAMRRASGFPEEADLVFWDADSLGDLPEGQTARSGLIVVSADPRLVIRAYRWHPAAFLGRAPEQAALREALDRCFSAWRRGMRWLDLPYKRDSLRVPLCQLHYAEAVGKETVLHCSGGTMHTGVLLGKLEEVLPSPPFFRCHRGFIIHLSYIEDAGAGELYLGQDRRSIPVSRRQQGELERLRKSWNAWAGMGTEESGHADLPDGMR